MIKFIKEMDDNVNSNIDTELLFYSKNKKKHKKNKSKEIKETLFENLENDHNSFLLLKSKSNYNAKSPESEKNNRASDKHLTYTDTVDANINTEVISVKKKHKKSKIKEVNKTPSRNVETLKNDYINVLAIPSESKSYLCSEHGENTGNSETCNKNLIFTNIRNSNINTDELSKLKSKKKHKKRKNKERIEGFCENLENDNINLLQLATKLNNNSNPESQKNERNNRTSEKHLTCMETVDSNIDTKVMSTIKTKKKHKKSKIKEINKTPSKRVETFKNNNIDLLTISSETKRYSNSRTGEDKRNGGTSNKNLIFTDIQNSNIDTDVLSTFKRKKKHKKRKSKEMIGAISENSESNHINLLQPSFELNSTFNTGQENERNSRTPFRHFTDLEFEDFSIDTGVISSLRKKKKHQKRKIKEINEILSSINVETFETDNINLLPISSESKSDSKTGENKKNSETSNKNVTFTDIQNSNIDTDVLSIHKGKKKHKKRKNKEMGETLSENSENVRINVLQPSSSSEPNSTNTEGQQNERHSRTPYKHSTDTEFVNYNIDTRVISTIKKKNKHKKNKLGIAIDTEVVSTVINKKKHNKIKKMKKTSENLETFENNINFLPLICESNINCDTEFEENKGNKTSDKVVTDAGIVDSNIDTEVLSIIKKKKKHKKSANKEMKQEPSEKVESFENDHINLLQPTTESICTSNTIEEDDHRNNETFNKHLADSNIDMKLISTVENKKKLKKSKKKNTIVTFDSEETLKNFDHNILPQLTSESHSNSSPKVKRKKYCGTSNEHLSNGDSGEEGSNTAVEIIPVVENSKKQKKSKNKRKLEDFSDNPEAHESNQISPSQFASESTNDFSNAKDKNRSKRQKTVDEKNTIADVNGEDNEKLYDNFAAEYVKNNSISCSNFNIPNSVKTESNVQFLTNFEHQNEFLTSDSKINPFADVQQIGDKLQQKNIVKNNKKTTAINTLQNTSLKCKKKSTLNKRKELQTSKSDSPSFSKIRKSSSKILQNLSTEVDENVSKYSFGNAWVDVTEDPVDFEVPPLHKCETVTKFTEPQIKQFESQKLFIRKGKFTPVEDNIILKNLKNFIKKYHVRDPFELLGIGRYVRDIAIVKFVKAKHFYVQLGKGLDNRTLVSIYKRARLLLESKKNLDSYNKDVFSSMSWLQQLNGRKWQKIGNILNMGADKCLQAYRWRHEKELNKGKWTDEEKNNLVKAIEKVTGNSSLSNDSIKNISWEKVAQYVPTRNYSQCRWYWANHLAWKSSSLKQKWNKECFVKLIKILKNEWDVEDASQIDWKKVYKSFEDVVPSPDNLLMKWMYLKTRISDYKNMNYRELLKRLCILFEVNT